MGDGTRRDGPEMSFTFYETNLVNLRHPHHEDDHRHARNAFDYDRPGALASDGSANYAAFGPPAAAVAPVDQHFSRPEGHGRGYGSHENDYAMSQTSISHAESAFAPPTQHWYHAPPPLYPGTVPDPSYARPLHAPYGWAATSGGYRYPYGSEARLPPVEPMGHYADYHPPAIERDRSGSSLSASSGTASDLASGPSESLPGRRRHKRQRRRLLTGPRFVWTPDLHGRFVAAVFEAGLKHAMAERVMASMGADAAAIAAVGGREGISLETIASRLRQYRAWHGPVREALASARQAVRHSPMKDTAESAGRDRNETTKRCYLELPPLTQEERESPLGASLDYLVGILQVLEDKLLAERAHAQGERSTSPPSGDDEEVG